MILNLFDLPKEFEDYPQIEEFKNKMEAWLKANSTESSMGPDAEEIKIATSLNTLDRFSDVISISIGYIKAQGANVACLQVPVEAFWESIGQEKGRLAKALEDHMLQRFGFDEAKTQEYLALKKEFTELLESASADLEAKDKAKGQDHSDCASCPAHDTCDHVNHPTVHLEASAPGVEIPEGTMICPGSTTVN